MGWPKFAWIVIVLAALGLMVGSCAKPAGIIFPPSASPRVWPAPPDPARIAWVGQLVTSADLKPAVPFGASLTRAIFGKEPAHSMLAPYAVCTDGGSRLFVADSQAQCVHLFDLQTRKYQKITPPAPQRFSQPVGVAWDPAGRLFVSDSVGGTIYIFDASMNLAGTITAELNRPAGITFDRLGSRLLVADTVGHCLLVFSPAGEFIRRLGTRGAAPGEFNYPTNVVADHAGRIYVSDTLNFRIQQFDSDLRPLRVIGKQGDVPGTFAQPKGIAVDSENHLYVVDAQFEAVQIFSPDGTLLLTFGQEGRSPGEFWLPAGIAIDPSDRIWIADSYNRRVQVLDYLGEVK